jgi:hypothetical protein
MAKTKKKVTKTDLVRKHILKKKSITTWQAIELYKATRLSAIIFNLKEEFRLAGSPIMTESMKSKDENGNTVNFVKYKIK